MKLVTGNDLGTGDVIWWTGSGWSRHVADAVDVGPDGEAILAAEQSARRVNSGYLIDATPTAEGPRPDHIKERIRALGPTVRLDLSLAPDADVAAVLK